MRMRIGPSAPCGTAIASQTPCQAAPTTPAFVYSAARMQERLALFERVRDRSGAQLLYSVKAQPFAGILDLIAPSVVGFSVSSLFEARLAAEVLQASHGQHGSLHLTTPGLRAADIEELGRLCTAISFNSLEQCYRFLPRLDPALAAGIRVNPGLSVVADVRYDPCRPHSKLGVPLESLRTALVEDGALAARITGLHFHTQFGISDATPLRATLRKVATALGGQLDALRWINLGGGFSPRDEADAEALGAVIHAFRERHPLAVWLEPGNAIVGPAGSLVSTVVDRFEREGKAIAVLDTGVQHLPEVFEYQKTPTLREHRPNGAYSCLLVGGTCLAGDVFGEYRFERPLAVGDRVSFENVGAYSLVKASRFNGHDLPALYLRECDGGLRLLKAFGYADFHRQWATAGMALAPAAAED